MVGYLRTCAIFDRELSAPEWLSLYNKGMNPSNYNDIPNNVFFTKLNTLNPIDQVLGNNGTSVNQDISNIICSI
jgi:hypothetical protein